MKKILLIGVVMFITTLCFSQNNVLYRDQFIDDTLLYQSGMGPYSNSWSWGSTAMLVNTGGITGVKNNFVIGNNIYPGLGPSYSNVTLKFGIDDQNISSGYLIFDGIYYSFWKDSGGEYGNLSIGQVFANSQFNNQPAIVANNNGYNSDALDVYGRESIFGNIFWTGTGAGTLTLATVSTLNIPGQLTISSKVTTSIGAVTTLFGAPDANQGFIYYINPASHGIFGVYSNSTWADFYAQNIFSSGNFYGSGILPSATVTTLTVPGSLYGLATGAVNAGTANLATIAITATTAQLAGTANISTTLINGATLSLTSSTTITLVASGSLSHSMATSNCIIFPFCHSVSTGAIYMQTNMGITTDNYLQFYLPITFDNFRYGHSVSLKSTSVIYQVAGAIGVSNLCTTFWSIATADVNGNIGNVAGIMGTASIVTAINGLSGGGQVNTTGVLGNTFTLPKAPLYICCTNYYGSAGEAIAYPTYLWAYVWYDEE